MVTLLDLLRSKIHIIGNNNLVIACSYYSDKPGVDSQKILTGLVAACLFYPPK